MAAHQQNAVEVSTGAAGSSQDIPEEMMAELKKEIARNVEATKLVKQREIEATYARDRAADSQRRMQEMMQKFEEMKSKLEWTRLTLAETHNRLEQHNNARSERIAQAVEQLKEKADICTQRLNDRSTADGSGGGSGVTSNSGCADSLSAAAAGEDAGGLTDAERMLLRMCQEQMAKDQQEANLAAPEGVQAAGEEASAKEANETSSVDNTTTAEADEEETFVGTTTNALDDVIVAEPPPKPYKPAKDYAKTVLDLQMKLSSSKTRPAASVAVASTTAVESVAVAEKEVVSETEPKTTLQSDNTTTEASRQEVTKHETSDESANGDASGPAAASCPEGAASAVVTKGENTEAAGGESVKEVSMDLNEQVSKMHAKVASVREELGQMAMSEQYMRTKQAQLLAKTREKEAQLAMELAAEKEREAQAMREKVTNMMKLLEERRNKLKMTEVVLEKKSVVVEKVNNILDSKERRANYVEKQHAECLAFDKKTKKN